MGPLEEEVIRALDKYTLDDPNAWDAKLFEERAVSRVTSRQNVS